MAAHTTFKVGGTADVYILPQVSGFSAFARTLLHKARGSGVPVFFLGGGANIVVSDRGIRGIVLDMTSWKGMIAPSAYADRSEVKFRSGTTMDEAAECAASLGLTGLEFFAGMPGTVGGAAFMNARCYGSEVADVLAWTEIIRLERKIRKGEDGREQVIIFIEQTRINRELFGYKTSPFQKLDCLITSACFKLNSGDKDEILNEMKKNREDRKKKGHYLFPCAGSAFKNNHAFGKPTGQIIDELGLKGLQIGGAQIAPFHGNIIINTGNATAADIRSLADEVIARVKAQTGFTLEPEILFVGG
jgi:UDP-N-acetylmuramate dehydrogenase